MNPGTDSQTDSGVLLHSKEGDHWFLLESALAGPEENMAVDEALLHASSQIGGPVLRFYRWSHPAASFGYSQRYADVSGWTSLRPLVRRPTGGGMVPHGTDWTYSLILPRGHAWHRSGARESYRRIHLWIQSALASLGVKTALSGGTSIGLAGQCFARPEESDLLFEGKKVAGAAQRRSRTGLLIQGSVQSGMLRLTETMWRRAMTAMVPTEGKVDWIELKLDSEVCRRVSELLRDKYLKPEYHQKR